MKKYIFFSMILLTGTSNISKSIPEKDIKSTEVGMQQAALEELLQRHQEEKKKDASASIWIPGILGLLGLVSTGFHYRNLNRDVGELLKQTFKEINLDALAYENLSQLTKTKNNIEFKTSRIEKILKEKKAYQKAKGFGKALFIGKDLLVTGIPIGFAGYNFYQNKKKEKRRSLELEEATKKLQEAQKKAAFQKPKEAPKKDATRQNQVKTGKESTVLFPPKKDP